MQVAVVYSLRYPTITLMRTPEKKKAYFNPGVTVDVTIFTLEEDVLKLLLIKRNNEPFKDSPALPGGFVREGETVPDTARRVLKEKAGVDRVYVEQLYTFDELGRDPRGQIISVSYFALVPREKVLVQKTVRTEDPHFVPVKNLPTLAFDHTHIVDYAIERLRDKILYTNIVYSLLPKLFTLSQLQKTYETILGKTIDKRNFRKKFVQLDLIESSGTKTSGTRQRPALLYRFKDTSPKKLKKFF